MPALCGADPLAASRGVLNPSQQLHLDRTQISRGKEQQQIQMLEITVIDSF